MKTRFQKGFHTERYIDRYILLFSCTCARVHFSFAIVQLVKKSRFNDKFFLRRVLKLCSNLKRTCRLSFFYKKACALQYKFAMANYMTDFGNEENSSRSSRVMRRHQIDRPNVMASEASDEAFLLTGCMKKCAVQGRD